MTAQRMKPRQNRRNNTRQSRGQRRDESFIYVMLIQSALCVVMLVAAFCLSNLTGMTGIKEAFSVLLHEENEAIEVSANLDKLTDAVKTDEARDMFNSVIEFILGKDPYDAQGGQFPVNAGDKSVPNSVMLEQVALSASAILPVQGKLSSDFGFRIHPVTGESDFHTGIDIAATEGSPIYAAYPGVVDEVGESKIYENYITLNHGGFKTRYCHCSKIEAKVGMSLRQGEKIALVGSTGVSTGPHLHFELLVNEKAADPKAAFQNGRPI